MSLRCLMTALLGAWLGGGALMAAGEAKAPAGWAPVAPRAEIRPAFSYDPEGGPNRAGALIIRSDAREGLQGAWTRAQPVEGGRFYRFRALRRARGIAAPRRAAVARVGRRGGRPGPAR
jgi:hypothetical protein